MAGKTMTALRFLLRSFEKPQKVMLAHPQCSVPPCLCADMLHCFDWCLGSLPITSFSLPSQSPGDQGIGALLTRRLHPTLAPDDEIVC